ncbi:MAG: hypothetical protein H6Q15_2207 [Bacteroidetes bacterium]|nr:hypothetical protein [Bacteroidota bacterium]
MEDQLTSYRIDKNRERDLVDNHYEYEKRFIERYAVLESNILVIKKIKKLAADKGTNDHVILWNVFGFINILSYDLVSVGYSLLFETKKWQKVYFARQVVLLMYEALNDIPDILGKDFKNIFKDISEANNYLMELKSLQKEFGKFKTIHFENLKQIRMNIIAHRDPDIDNQLHYIETIDPYEIINIMLDFENILRSISDHLQKLMVRTIKF